MQTGEGGGEKPKKTIEVMAWIHNRPQHDEGGEWANR